MVLPVILGATVPEDHHYLVYSMLKAKCRKDLTARGWTFAPLKGRRLDDIIHFHRKDGPPALVLRCPLADMSYVHKLASAEVRVSHHLLRFGDPVARDIEPCPVLRSPLVMVTSDAESSGVRGTNFGLHVGKRLGAMLGHLNFGVDIGPRRAVHIAGGRYFGHPVTVKSLTDQESIMLQCVGIGESRGMGLGAFWPERVSC